MGCFDTRELRRFFLGPFAASALKKFEHGPTNPLSSPVQQIVASEQATKKKKKPFGQAQRPQDLGLLSLGTGGKLGGNYAAMDKMRGIFG